jgi:hypothetical protein
MGGTSIHRAHGRSLAHGTNQRHGDIVKVQTAGTVPYGRQGDASAVYAQLTRFGEVLSVRQYPYTTKVADLQIPGSYPPGTNYGTQPADFSKNMMKFLGPYWKLLGSSAQAEWKTAAPTALVFSFRTGLSFKANGYTYFLALNKSAAVGSPYLGNQALQANPNLSWGLPPSDFPFPPTLSNLVVTDVGGGAINIAIDWIGAGGPYILLNFFASRSGRYSIQNNPAVAQLWQGTIISTAEHYAVDIPTFYQSRPPEAPIGKSFVFAARAASYINFTDSQGIFSPPLIISHKRTA